MRTSLNAAIVAVSVLCTEHTSEAFTASRGPGRWMSQKRASGSSSTSPPARFPTSVESATMDGASFVASTSAPHHIAPAHEAPTFVKPQAPSVTDDVIAVPEPMPWGESIDKTSPLLFLDFYLHHLQEMEGLSGLTEVTGSMPPQFHYSENPKKKARLINRVFKSDRFRKIRVLYYDGGPNTQVFNALWYPRPEYDMPVLGIDLLAFARKKHLTVIDCQPLHKGSDLADHEIDATDTLRDIKARYPELAGQMSSKFYDETQFFSKEMIFARFEDEKIVPEKLYPAFKEYLASYMGMMDRATPNDGTRLDVLDRQREYDVYSAERDPATGMFASIFGKEWADEFVYDHLFSLSTS